MVSRKLMKLKIKKNLIFNIMNILLEKLNPIVTKCGLDNIDEIEILKGPCKKIGVRPAHVVFICGVVSIASIVFGIAARFLSTFVSMIYPAYRSI